MREVNIQNCGRENDLIGFLYGELSESEARGFERHLHECAACEAELASFGGLRELVVAWRNESLASVGLTSPVTSSSPTRAAEVRPSAMAALRQFFNLSPLWMKGAVAFAAILFCVLGGLALARLRDKPANTVAVTPAAPTHSQQELNALVERRVQDELKRIKNSQEQSATTLAVKNPAQENPVKRTGKGNTEVASSQKARRPLSKTEREQLAADLGLVSAKNDSDLRLLGDTINQ